MFDDPQVLLWYVALAVVGVAAGARRLAARALPPSEEAGRTAADEDADMALAVELARATADASPLITMATTATTAPCQCACGQSTKECATAYPAGS